MKTPPVSNEFVPEGCEQFSIPSPSPDRRIERVARRLCQVSGGKPDSLKIIKEIRADTLPPDGYDDSGRGGHYYWRKWELMARVAIAEIEVL